MNNRELYNITNNKPRKSEGALIDLESEEIEEKAKPLTGKYSSDLLQLTDATSNQLAHDVNEKNETKVIYDLEGLGNATRNILDSEINIMPDTNSFHQSTTQHNATINDFGMGIQCDDIVATLSPRDAHRISKPIYPNLDVEIRRNRIQSGDIDMSKHLDRYLQSRYRNSLKQEEYDILLNELKLDDNVRTLFSNRDSVKLYNDYQKMQEKKLKDTTDFKFVDHRLEDIQNINDSMTKTTLDQSNSALIKQFDYPQSIPKEINPLDIQDQTEQPCPELLFDGERSIENNFYDIQNTERESNLDDQNNAKNLEMHENNILKDGHSLYDYLDEVIGTLIKKHFDKIFNNGSFDQDRKHPDLQIQRTDEKEKSDSNVNTEQTLKNQQPKDYIYQKNRDLDQNSEKIQDNNLIQESGLRTTITNQQEKIFQQNIIGQQYTQNNVKIDPIKELEECGQVDSLKEPALDYKNTTNLQEYFIKPEFKHQNNNFSPVHEYQEDKIDPQENKTPLEFENQESNNIQKNNNMWPEFSNLENNDNQQDIAHQLEINQPEIVYNQNGRPFQPRLKEQLNFSRPQDTNLQEDVQNVPNSAINYNLQTQQNFPNTFTTKFNNNSLVKDQETYNLNTEKIKKNFGLDEQNYNVSNQSYLNTCPTQQELQYNQNHYIIPLCDNYQQQNLGHFQNANVQSFPAYLHEPIPQIIPEHVIYIPNEEEPFINQNKDVDRKLTNKANKSSQKPTYNNQQNKKYFPFISQKIFPNVPTHDPNLDNNDQQSVKKNLFTRSNANTIVNKGINNESVIKYGCKETNPHDVTFIKVQEHGSYTHINGENNVNTNSTMSNGQNCNDPPGNGINTDDPSLQKTKLLYIKITKLIIIVFWIMLIIIYIKPVTAFYGSKQHYLKDVIGMLIFFSVLIILTIAQFCYLSNCQEYSVEKLKKDMLIFLATKVIIIVVSIIFVMCFQNHNNSNAS